MSSLARYGGLNGQVSIICPCQEKPRGEVAEWLKAADCKSARIAYTGSNPVLSTIFFQGLLDIFLNFDLSGTLGGQSVAREM